MKVTVGFEGYSGGLREHGGSVKCWDLFSNPDGFGVGEFLRLAQHFNGAFLEPTPQGSLLELGKRDCTDSFLPRPVRNMNMG